MANSNQVVTEIVDQDICCGCGICAGICPFHNLQMVWRENGDLAPRLLGDCVPGCRLCLKVCPFGPKAASENRLGQERFAVHPGIKHQGEAGYYLEAFGGYSRTAGHRQRGASGGMATWLAEQLLREGQVDAVVCVAGGEDNAGLFAYRILTEVESLRAAAGSRYYPVDLSQTVSRIIQGRQEVRYAVVGLPCVLKGLRLAMEVQPRLRRRVVFTLGLTCGHLPNRYYTEFLASLSGISPAVLASAQYRLKDGSGPASDFKFKAFARNGKFGRALTFTKISNYWTEGYFQVNACNFCDDVFAEVADVCFMDAWLPEYVRDHRGHSLLVVRHPELLTLLKAGEVSDSCEIKTLQITKVIESQCGVIEKKVVMLGARLFAAAVHGRKTPAKRCLPEAEAYKRHRRKLEAHYAVQQFSKARWSSLGARSLLLYRICLLWLSLPLKVDRLVARFGRVLKRPALLLRLVWRS